MSSSKKDTKNGSGESLIRDNCCPSKVFLCSFGDFLWRRHVVFSSKIIFHNCILCSCLTLINLFRDHKLFWRHYLQPCTRCQEMHVWPGGPLCRQCERWHIHISAQRNATLEAQPPAKTSAILSANLHTNKSPGSTIQRTLPRAVILILSQ
jgi:hypothetical protein